MSINGKSIAKLKAEEGKIPGQVLMSIIDKSGLKIGKTTPMIRGMVMNCKRPLIPAQTQNTISDSIHIKAQSIMLAYSASIITEDPVDLITSFKNFNNFVEKIIDHILSNIIILETDDNTQLIDIRSQTGIDQKAVRKNIKRRIFRYKGILCESVQALKNIDIINTSTKAIINYHIVTIYLVLSHFNNFDRALDTAERYK